MLKPTITTQKMSRRRPWILWGVLLGGGIILASSQWSNLYLSKDMSESGKPHTVAALDSTPSPEAAVQPPKSPEMVKTAETKIYGRFKVGETLVGVLGRHKVSFSAANRLSHALSRKVNLRAIRPGEAFSLTFKGDKKENKVPLEFMLFQNDVLGVPLKYRATLEGAGSSEEGALKYTVSEIITPVKKRVGGYGGKVESSLYGSMIKVGGDPTLVNRFSDVFGYQVDFYRETQSGDQFKLLVEENLAAGRFVSYGRVFAAEYVGRFKTHQGYYYHSEDGKVVGVFDEEGSSLEKTFLKTPLDLARITSRFGRRFHPILKRHIHHPGIDYGARKGTPFYSVADGVVVYAGYKGAAGKMIRIRHGDGYVTQYLHASRIAKGLKKGSTIKQRQIIGYVGSTGRSTGPHLHFGMKRHGRNVNPRKQKFKSGRGVPAQYLPSYIRKIEPFKARLDGMEI